MPRKPKYPTPEEARRRFETGVEAAREKYVSRAREGADNYQLWFAGFAAKVYPVVAGLPDPEGLSIRDKYVLRGAPVGEAIHRLSLAYRKAKSKRAEEIAAREAARVIS